MPSARGLKWATTRVGAPSTSRGFGGGPPPGPRQARPRAFLCRLADAWAVSPVGVLNFGRTRQGLPWSSPPPSSCRYKMAHIIVLFDHQIAPLHSSTHTLNHVHRIELHAIRPPRKIGDESFPTHLVRRDLSAVPLDANRGLF